MNILFLIRSLENGGAERQLTVLANELSRRGHAITVAVFHGGGLNESRLDLSRVRLVNLHKAQRGVSFWPRLFGLVRRVRPDVLHGYLSAGNVAAALVRRIAAPNARLVWGIRDSEMTPKDFGAFTRLTASVAHQSARFADLAIFNSHAGRDFWQRRGWLKRDSVVIPNGIDVARFCPDATAGLRMRERWGIGRGTPVIGGAGRFDPMKGQRTFLEAAAKLAGSTNACFVWAGDGRAAYREDLESKVRELGLAGRVLFPGAFAEMPDVYNAFDVFCLPSHYGEGFPNVVGEAMACGKPVIVADVGDAARVAGNLGRVVPPRDAAALASAMADALRDTKSNPGSGAAEIRQRILENFTVPVLADRTEEALGLVPAPAQDRSTRLTAAGSLPAGQ